VEDAVLEVWTTTYATTDYQVAKTYERNEDDLTTTWASSNEAVATVSANGLAEWVSDGTATITATLGDWSQDLELTFSSNAVTYTNIVAGVDTYWREAVTTPIDDALTADAGANDDELFDTKDWVNHNYVRNASAWAYAATGGSTAPWTGLAVWETGKTTAVGWQPIRGTLISSNVVACAWHNRPGVGSQYKWLGTDDVVYTRTVTAQARVGNGDGCVVLLDSPLPAEVQPLQILPEDFATYLFLQVGNPASQLPALTVNRHLQASVVDSSGILNGAAGWYKSRIALREGYYQTPVTGDSGSPQILTDGTTLILVSSWLTPWGGANFVQGTNLTNALNLLGGSAVAPTVYDITSYPKDIPPGPGS